MTTTCPKCQYRRTAIDNQVHADICPGCGIVYSKWIARREDPQNEIRIEPELRQSFLQWLTEAPEQVDAVAFWSRAVCAFLFAIWSLYFICNGIDWEVIGGSFMHVVNLPFQIAGSATTSYYSGFPELTTVLVNSRTVALTQSSQSVIVSERGTTRFPNVYQLDVSLRRLIRLQNTRLEPRIDFYNLTNESAVQRRVTVLGPAYPRPSDVQRGRLIKFGMSLDF